MRSLDLNGMDLSGLNLRGASLESCKLTNVNLKGSDLTGANLAGADLRGAQLEGAKLDDVFWQHTICPDGAVLKRGALTTACKPSKGLQETTMPRYCSEASRGDPDRF